MITRDVNWAGGYDLVLYEKVIENRCVLSLRVRAIATRDHRVVLGQQLMYEDPMPVIWPSTARRMTPTES
jgi:hypothetical protein